MTDSLKSWCEKATNVYINARFVDITSDLRATVEAAGARKAAEKIGGAGAVMFNEGLKRLKDNITKGTEFVKTLKEMRAELVETGFLTEKNATAVDESVAAIEKEVLPRFEEVMKMEPIAIAEQASDNTEPTETETETPVKPE